MDRLAAFGMALAAVSAAAETLPFSIGGDETAAIAWARTFSTSRDDWVNDLLPLRSGRVMAGAPRSWELTVSVSER